MRVTPQVRLRRYLKSDRYRFLAWNSCPWTRQFMDGPLSVAQGEQLFDRVLRHQPTQDDQAWAIELTNGRHIGHAFITREATPGWRAATAPALGLLLDRDFHARGFATAAGKLAMAAYFRSAGPAWLTASVDSNHFASRRWLWRLGMRPLQVLHDQQGAWFLYGCQSSTWSPPGRCSH